MRKFLLIRHVQPEITLSTPARIWPLSPEGHASTLPLTPCIGDHYLPIEQA
ncbi:hypothetical protein [Ktedonobacter sp. SOSP1-85]|uniref:hypothetical protein n=1 Tax=Ktedonobacter sp. SOSP1-85 TaxID=2778367 RepID=UPI001915B42B|nr:hypothetical protein [Ktedonobacter sp. SOSP1-85]